MMAWQFINPSSVGLGWETTAYLCAGEDDWYAFDSDSLGYEIYMVDVSALVKDAGYCGEICEQTVIPPGPQHAMTIDVHRADTMEILVTTSEEDGVLKLSGSGEVYSHDLLIHIYSPTPDARRRVPVSDDRLDPQLRG